MLMFVSSDMSCEYIYLYYNIMLKFTSIIIVIVMCRWKFPFSFVRHSLYNLQIKL